MNKLPNFTQAMTQLIASPSISSTQADWDQGNLPVIQLLASWFEPLGAKIDIQKVPHSRNKFNLLAKFGSGDGGLLLSGHTDTVPFDENRWQSDPFTLTTANDKFYGLGTCDMKGFFAFILQVCKTIDTKQLKKPLYILATADEETTMAGARFFAKEQSIKPDAAVIGEPTSLVPIMMHKGHMSHRIVVKGQAGHSSAPDKGVNAIEIMYEIIGALLRLKNTMKTDFDQPRFNVPFPTLNFGAIKGGDNANRICGQCHLDMDMRALPGMKDEELLFWLTDALAPLATKYPARITLTELHPSSPSFEQDKPSALIDLAEQFSGHSCCAVNYATEAPFLQQLGCHTIVMGPGSIDQAHQPNEYLAFDQIAKTEQLLTQLVNHYCLK